MNVWLRLDLMAKKAAAKAKIEVPVPETIPFVPLHLELGGGVTFDAVADGSVVLRKGVAQVTLTASQYAQLP